MATAARMLDDRPLILVTTVDIGRGRTDVIELRQGDSPEVWDTSGHLPFHDSATGLPKPCCCEGVPPPILAIGLTTLALAWTREGCGA